ncbi:MAG: hypothetical protein ACW99G_01320 [Candidatus Thorarchaeota archaeon]
MTDTPAENTKKSLVVQDGNLPQPLEQDVVAQSTKIDNESFKRSEVIVLMAILQGITEHTFSPDVGYLGVCRAKQLCELYGIEESVVDDVVDRYHEFAKDSVKNNPISEIF